MNDRDTILDRVRKLLRLGESNNPNESAAALAAAQRLIDKYRLSELELAAEEGLDETVAKDPTPLWAGKRLVSWRGALAQELCAANGVLVVWSARRGRGGSLIMAGRPEDCALVRHLFHHCMAEIDRLTLVACAGRGRAYANAFRIGCVQAIAAQLSAQTWRLRQTASSAALVRLDDRLDRARKLFGPVHTRRAAQYSSGAGLAAGQRAGAGINLHAGALGGSRRALKGGA